MAATDQLNNACGTSHTDVSEPTGKELFYTFMKCQLHNTLNDNLDFN
jgi:hypothetical protein